MYLIEVIKSIFSNVWAAQVSVSLAQMAVSLALACVLAFYIGCVYRQLTRRGMPSPQFEKALVCLPVIAATLVFALKMNVLVSLGAIGALSIVRFRNATKDPLDFIFLLWGVVVGMLCGTSVYLVAIFASMGMTVVLFALDFRPKRHQGYVLFLRCAATAQENEIEAVLAPNSTHRVVRSHTTTQNGFDLLVALHTQQAAALVAAVAQVAGVEQVSLVAHDGALREDKKR